MPHRVLLIDDAPSIHALVRNELARDDVETFVAPDGLAGINAARRLRPDLILLDVAMPGMDGYEVCELLGVQPETAGIPVIFLSASGEPADRAHGLNQGASDYIVKPFYGDELRARVRVSLRYKAMLEIESRRALRDGLTGLWNRTYLDTQLASLSAAAARHGWPLACVMLDLDHFKAVNDTYGHAFGDEAIRSVAATIEAGRRKEDVACRYGGEEFVLLCPGVGATGGAVLAERLRAAIEARPVDGPTGPVRLTCSFGVAGGLLGPALLGAADRMLYEAKRAGRNCVRLLGAAGGAVRVA